MTAWPPDAWTSRGPSAWPPPPREMSFSALSALEACPRQYALRNAEYPELWKRPGYPARVNLGALAGTVVHASLEEINMALSKSPDDPAKPSDAVTVMRGLGGYSGVVARAIEGALETLRQNPRAAPLMEHAARELRSQIPELRARVQRMLSCVRRGTDERSAGPRGGRGSRAPSALPPGVHSEIRVSAPDLGWAGRLDLLIIDGTECAIVDFKTGAEDPRHAEQLRTYAVLWRHDKVLNPGGRLANKLTLTYGSGNHAVPAPDDGELGQLTQQLVARTNAAKSSLREPIEARVNPENCRHCQVRHMCIDYWRSPPPRAGVDTQGPVDAELMVGAKAGPNSWTCLVSSSTTGAAKGTPIVLQAPERPVHTGQTLRVLDAFLSALDDGGGTPVIALGRTAECYLVDSQRDTRTSGSL
jgi:hypothetical protein